MNISHMSFEILLIPNPMLRESLVPNRKPHAEGLSDLERRPTLNKTDRSLQCRSFSGSEENVQVLGHHNITMDEVTSLVSIFEKLRFNKFRGRALEEYPSPFPCVRGDEIRFSGSRSMLGSRHAASGAKAPSRRHLLAAGLKARPSVPPFMLVRLVVRFTAKALRRQQFVLRA